MQIIRISDCEDIQLTENIALYLGSAVLCITKKQKYARGLNVWNKNSFKLMSNYLQNKM